MASLRFSRDSGSVASRRPLLHNETPGSFGNHSPVIMPDSLAFEHRDPPPTLEQPAFEIDAHAYRKRLAIANVRSRRGTAFASEEDPVGHDVVEQAEEDSAVRDAFIADTLVTRREFCATHFAVQTEAHPQTPGIARTTNETPVGGRLEGHRARIIAECF